MELQDPSIIWTALKGEICAREKYFNMTNTRNTNWGGLLNNFKWAYSMNQSKATV